MNAFKRKALTSAVLAGLGAVGTAHAVYQDPNGQGQALIYPYYTVNTVGSTAFNTYISVVNTTALTKVVRFRVREGRNSVEVRDFNIYLSPNDIWAAAIIPLGSGAQVITTDNSCTSPVLPELAPATATSAAVRGIDFTNTLYTAAGGADDGAGTGLDRLREGYVEIIELGTLDPTVAPGTLTVHNTSGVPPCGAALLEPAAGVAPPAVVAAIAAPTGGINGTGTLIHVDTGNATGYNAVALSNLTSVAIFGAIANDSPNFNAADPVSVVISNNNAYRSDWSVAPAGYRAVSATMMHSSVINEYVLDNGTRSQTDWVMTFPTKRGFVTGVGAAAVANPPFTNKFTATGACEPISFAFFNREEQGQTAGTGGFSPLPPGAPASSLCWESTVLSIRNPSGTAALTGSTSGVLASANTTAVNIASGFQNGWARLTFTGVNATTIGLVSDATSSTTNVLTGVVTAGAQTFFGLPVVGFMVRTLQNTAVACGSSGCNFGGLFGHKYEQNITP